MKFYTLQKTSYTSGIYGCTGEQYLFAIYEIDDNQIKIVTTLYVDGLYGHEHRICEALNNKGYKKIAELSARYGRITRREGKYSLNEKDAIEKIKEME